MTFDPKCEIFVNGTWTDITSDVQYDSGAGISITRGVTGVATTPDPTACSFLLDNTSGNYSPDNPVGAYYGQLGNNTPFRVSMPGYESRMELDGSAGGYASTPHTAALNITDALDIRIELDADVTSHSGSVVLAQKYSETVGQKAWQLRIGGDGFIYFEWWDSSNILWYIFFEQTFVPGRAIRCVFDADNGAGGVSFTAYYADSISGDWNVGWTYSDALGTHVIKSTSTSALRVTGEDTTDGYTPLPGFIRAFQLRNSSGSIVADVDFTIQTAGSTSFVGTDGLTWTLSGTAAITDRDYRFRGEIADWPVQWVVDWVYSDINAAGLRRRLMQGAKPISSALAKRIPKYNPLAYWPMEDGVNAAQATSPIAGVRPMTTRYLTFAAQSSLPSSAPLPVLNTMSNTVSPVVRGAVPGTASTEWAATFLFYLPSAVLSGTPRTYMSVYTSGTAARWDIQLDSTPTAHVVVTDNTGAVISTINISIGAGDITDRWVYNRLYTYQSGSSVKWGIEWRAFETNGAGLFEQTLTGSHTTGVITAVGSPPGGYSTALEGLGLGHVSTWPIRSPLAYIWQGTVPAATALNAFEGETASERMGRLAIDYGVPFRPLGLLDEQQRVGYQGQSTTIGEMDSAAKSDGSMLLDDRALLCMTYRDKSYVYSQTALEIQYAQLQPGLQPQRDDTVLVNSFTATRNGGSSADHELDDGSRLSISDPPTGAGLYGSSDTYSLYTDDQPEQIAAWQVALGTIDAPRYSVVEVELAKWLSLRTGMQQLDVLNRVQITGCPTGKTPPGTQDLIVRGYTETISRFLWNFKLNCLPYGPWRALVWEADTGTALGDDSHWDTDGSVLASSATSTATTLLVTTTAGARWTTDQSDFPFNLLVAGEEVAVQTLGTVLNANPGFEVNTTDWTATSATLTRSSAVARYGSWSGLLTTTAGSNPRAETGLHAVTTGQLYWATGWLYSPDVLPTNAAVNVNWYDSGSVYLSTSSMSVALPQNSWTLVVNEFTAPASAAFATVLFTVSGTPGAGYRLYGDQVMLVDNAAASGVVSDTFTRTVSSGWGTADTGQAYTLSGTTSDFSVNGTRGLHTVSATNAGRNSVVDAGFTDFDVTCQLGALTTSTGASQHAGLVGRYADASNYYWLRVELTTANAVIISIRKNVAGTDTQLATLTTSKTNTAAHLWAVRFQGTGSQLRAKLWDPSAEIEPTWWQLNVTDTALTIGTHVGTRSLRPTGNTNSPCELIYDVLVDSTPQRMTVTRSVNGISKSHSTGEPIQLAQPSYLVL